MRFILFYSSFIVVLMLIEAPVFAQNRIDTLKNGYSYTNINLLDSLKENAEKREITKFLFDLLYTVPKDTLKSKKKRQYSEDYYKKFSGKKIVFIYVKSLNVFLQGFKEDAKKNAKWYEKMGSKLHTQTNLKTIKRLLLFHENDTVSPALFIESERLVRALPHIKDIKIIVDINKNDPQQVGVYVITKDRFSWGGSAEISPFSSFKVELYNKNIFGRGHELSFHLIGHINEKPHIGFKSFYSLSNIRGKFIDATIGYMDYYREKGLFLDVTKPFITPTIKWGYNLTALRMTKAFEISPNHPVKLENPINVLFLKGWAGYSFNYNMYNSTRNYQIVATAGFFKQKFYSLPTQHQSSNQFFYNSTFYLAGLTFSERRYVQDELIYSYGITEDIPEGFKNEIVVGYDDNQFGDRIYGHILFSDGNFLRNKLSYLNISAGIGGFFHKKNFEQGVVQADINFISKLYNYKKNRYRFFFNSYYKIGIKRFEIENLYLNTHDYIRGFYSNKPKGKQRLAFNFEYVYFLNKQFYRFNMAFFGFADLGIIGANTKMIYHGDYYSGLGIGMRVHNENLVFRTLQLRLAFYPYAPKGMAFVDLLFDEQNKRKFYNYQPAGPIPLQFE